MKHAKLVHDKMSRIMALEGDVREIVKIASKVVEDKEIELSIKHPSKKKETQPSHEDMTFGESFLFMGTGFYNRPQKSGDDMGMWSTRVHGKVALMMLQVLVDSKRNEMSRLKADIEKIMGNEVQA